MRILRCLAIALSTSFVLACSNPCEDVAELTCASLGVETSECTEARAKASKADSVDKHYCDVALELVDRLERRE